MKRLLSLALVAAMMMALSGCMPSWLSDYFVDKETQEYAQKEQEILSKLEPAERFEITNADGEVLLTQDDIEKAEWQWYTMNMEDAAVPVVLLTFTKDGAGKFADATTLYIGQELPILLDGEEIVRPLINEPITDGVAVLSGDKIDSFEKAVEIAARINSTKE